MPFSVFNRFLAINFSYSYPRNTSFIGHFTAKLFVCGKAAFYRRLGDIKDSFVFASFTSAIFNCSKVKSMSDIETLNIETLILGSLRLFMYRIFNCKLDLIFFKKSL